MAILGMVPKEITRKLGKGEFGKKRVKRVPWISNSHWNNDLLKR